VPCLNLQQRLRFNITHLPLQAFLSGFELGIVTLLVHREVITRYQVRFLMGELERTLPFESAVDWLPYPDAWTFTFWRRLYSLFQPHASMFMKAIGRIFTHVYFFYFLQTWVKREGRAIPITGREGPWGCETSRLPHFLDNRLAALRAGRPWRSLVLIFVREWVNPRAIVRLEGLGKLKKNPMTSSRIEPATFRFVT
jgi:hypothetical protein